MELYAPLHPRLCRYVQNLIWDREEARDLISEVTLAALSRFDESINQEKFLYYLFGIARNCYLKLLRKNRFISPEEPSDGLQLKSGNSADHSLNKKELYRLLATLKEDEREALVLFEINGFSYTEIEQIMKLPAGKVKPMLYAARQKLYASAQKESKRMELVIETGLSWKGGSI